MTAPEKPRAEAQRERILAAAQQCFIRRGFHAAGMAAIAEVAGMSPGLIYRYFRDKQEVLFHAISAVQADYMTGPFAAQPANEARLPA